MAGEQLQTHCMEIERCNQRGGRMLSIVDLLEAGTITPDLAAYAMAAIGRGASFLVGALPGGAGKTTVMGALLNFVPGDVVLRPADGMRAIERGLGAERPRCCYICHEIGSGPYYAYLWGGELRAYFELPTAGHSLATNLHADTYEQARDQICGDNGVPAAALCRMGLMFFLSVRRSGLGASRRIVTAWESDGRAPHLMVFSAEASDGRVAASALVSEADVSEAASAIDRLAASGARTIEQVRRAVCGLRGEEGTP